MTSISVIIPTYNEEKLIEPTLLSVRSQTIPAKEIIVVDGNSKDNTRKIAKKYAKVINKKSSVPIARNIGAKASKSDLLLFLDADTLLLPNALEMLSQPFNNDGVVITSLPLFPLQMKFKHYVITKIGWEMVPKFFIKYNKPIFCGACIMVKKTAFNEINGFKDMKTNDDIDFVERISKIGKSEFVEDTFALTDMRRFEKNSLYWSIYWVSNWFYYKLRKKGWKDYKKIR